MNHFLVRYQDNWADEFDIEGIGVFTEDELNRMYVSASGVKYPKECYFGTNESVVYESYEDWRRCLTVEPITAGEYGCIKRLRLDGIGTFLIPEE